MLLIHLVCHNLHALSKVAQVARCTLAMPLGYHFRSAVLTTIGPVDLSSTVAGAHTYYRVCFITYAFKRRAANVVSRGRKVRGRTSRADVVDDAHRSRSSR